MTYNHSLIYKLKSVSNEPTQPYKISHTSISELLVFHQKNFIMTLQDYIKINAIFCQ